MYQAVTYLTKILLSKNKFIIEQTNFWKHTCVPESQKTNPEGLDYRKLQMVSNNKNGSFDGDFLRDDVKRKIDKSFADVRFHFTFNVRLKLYPLRLAFFFSMTARQFFESRPPVVVENESCNSKCFLYFEGLLIT